MTRLRMTLVIAAIAAFAVGCGSDAPAGDGEACDEDQVGEDCTCDEGDEERDGTFECVGEQLSCDCADAVANDNDDDDDDAAADDDDDDDAAAADDDDGKDDDDDDDSPTATRDAAVDARTPSTGDAGSDATAPDDDDDDAPTDDDDDGAPSTGGVDPILPEITGECPTFRNGTIMAGGRGNITIVAGEPNKKGPLLFYWHGTGSTAGEYRGSLGGVANEITAAGGIIASFSGGPSQASGGGDCSGTGTHSKNDFNAADVIAACAVKNHGIDPRRIYTTGCSAGGLQAGCMGMARSNYIAAVAPNSGGIVGRQPWQGMASPAVFTMHGGPQDMVIVTFSQTSASYGTAAKGHGSFVVNCNHGGGHCRLPRGLMDAAWKFMSDHPFGSSAESPWKSGIPSGVPDYCEIK